MAAINLAGLALKNPVMTGSGTFGYGKEFAEFYDLSALGAVVCKTITLNARDGNKPPRVADFSGGMLNSIGLENKGVEYFVNTALPFLAKFDTKCIVSIAGSGAAEYGELAQILDGQSGAHAIEINLSCPNVAHGQARGLFAQDCPTAAAIVKAVRAGTKKPVFAKLTAMVSDISQIAAACKDAGADGLTLINTLPAMMVDLKTRRPMLGNIAGGLSGGVIKPVALKVVWDVWRATQMPIIASGGVMTSADALEFILCGATAVQVGSANFVNPFAAKEVADGIEQYFKDNKIKDICELRGQLKI